MKIFLSTVLALWLGVIPYAPPLFTGIAFDNSSQNAFAASSSFTITSTHNVGSGATVLFACGTGSTGFAPMTASFNGVSMTSIASSDTGGYHEQAFYLINPAAGSHTLSITQSDAGAGSNYLALAGVSYSGADTTTVPEDAANTGTDDGNAQPTHTTIADNAWIFVCSGGSTDGNQQVPAGDPLGTLRATAHATFMSVGAFDNGPQTPAGSTGVHTESAGTSFQPWIAFTFAPSTGGGGGGSGVPPGLIRNFPIGGCCSIQGRD